MGDILVITDALIVIGGTTLSDNANKVEIPIEADELDVSTFGGVWKKRASGMLDGKVNVSLFQSFEDLDGLMWGWVTGRQLVPFSVMPVDGPTSAGNPLYSGMLLPKHTSPLAAGVGEVNKWDLSWPTSGAVTRATS